MCKDFFIYRVIIVLTIWLVATGDAAAKKDTLLLSRMYGYAETIDTANVAGSHTFAYQRFFIKTDRRNALLMGVPTMWGVAHSGNRAFAGEAYERVNFYGIGHYDTERLLGVNTIPHRRSAMPTLLKYLTPEIYNSTILKDFLLSPFHRKNRRFYRYRVTYDSNGTAIVTFRPKVDNTQLVAGQAVVDFHSGRIITTELNGEYDMINFKLTLEMGDEGITTLLPVRCQLETHFSLLGNKLIANYLCYYGLTTDVESTNTTIEGPEAADSFMKLAALRPEPLGSEEETVINEYLEKEQQQWLDTKDDTLPTPKKKHSLARTIFWDVLGDHLLNRVKQRFGPNDQGYLRINPILNPLYLGYSDRKGITYKFDVRSSYNFTPNRDISLRIKAGYSFKQRQLFLYVPLRFNYNKRRHAFFAIDLDYGRHIYNSEISNEINPITRDTLEIQGLRLDYFRDTYVRIYNNYDISSRFSFNVGFTLHNRMALHAKAFKQLGLRTQYRSFAPRAEVQYRPLGWKGPILTLDYERGIKGVLSSNTEYERWEADGSYILNMSRMQALSMRLGAGIYSRRAKGEHFLDFTNFRDNNMPGGWNDDWSGEFELLRSEWYNSSLYYVRANTTYESPLLIISRLPLLGHFIEMERLYFGAVMAKEMKPYIELGYGLTTRLVSLGAFVGNKNGHFERVGVRFGFELFRKW